MTDTNAMTRLDEALQAHEKKLRDELIAALRKKKELEVEVEALNSKIEQNEMDLKEVVEELHYRGIAQEVLKGYVIVEVFDPENLT